MSIVSQNDPDKPFAFASRRNHHQVVISGDGSVAVLSCKEKTPLRSVGDCGAGCCDRYECPDCGERFLVEWPD